MEQLRVLFYNMNGADNRQFRCMALNCVDNADDKQYEHQDAVNTLEHSTNQRDKVENASASHYKQEKHKPLVRMKPAVP